MRQDFPWRLQAERRSSPGDVAMVVTNRNSAELIKHASNCFLAMKISYINAVANLCDQVGADVDRVAEGMGLDHRIGPHFLQRRHRLRRVLLSQGSAGVHSHRREPRL